MPSKKHKVTPPQMKILSHMRQGMHLGSATNLNPRWAWLMSPIDARCSNVRTSVFVAMVRHKLIRRVSEDEQNLGDWVINTEVVKITEIDAHIKRQEENLRKFRNLITPTNR